MRERRRQNRTVTIAAASAMSGPKTNAPVMAASIDMSCVLVDRVSTSSIPPNSPTRSPPMAARRVSPNIFTKIDYEVENVVSSVGAKHNARRESIGDCGGLL